MVNRVIRFLRIVAPPVYRTFPQVRRLRYAIADRGWAAALSQFRPAPRPQQDPASLPPVVALSDLSDATRAIAFPEHAAPRVSIIVPVYNKAHYTVTCLRSLAAHASRAPFEVIVVDDNSTDDTARLLAGIPGLRVLRNAENRGFIANCNSGADTARGDLLIFLNNDVNLFPGWLDALVEAYDREPDAGVVGSKLIYGEGTLQEAGGIIWEDGSGANYGRGGHPDDPRYCFVRDADYVSGASLLIERALFRTLGGFDTRYSPAYYEDTDLCFRVREEAGRRVIYQPHSALVHYEGISSGTSEATGVKRHQALNRPKFRERWSQVLAGHGDGRTSSRLAAADRRPDRHMLVVDHRIPMPDRDSGSIDMMHVLEILAGEGWRVHFFPLYTTEYEPRYFEPLQALGIECAHAPFYSRLEPFLAERAGIITDVILSRETVAARAMAPVKKWLPEARVLFHTVDLHFLRAEREARLSASVTTRRRAREIERSELALARTADATLVISEHERDVLKARGIGNVHVLPLIRRFGEPDPAPFEAREGVLFFGGFEHPPNLDAARFLVDEIWPRVRALRAKAGAPPVPLVLAGSQMPDSLHAAAADDVRVLGYVEDPDALHAGVRLSIAPLRYGAGLKGKVLISLAHGVPVIGTPVAFEGFPADGAEGLFNEAADADGLARRVVALYDDSTSWARQNMAGAAYARRHFSVDAARRRLLVAAATPCLPLDGVGSR